MLIFAYMIESRLVVEYSVSDDFWFFLSFKSTCFKCRTTKKFIKRCQWVKKKMLILAIKKDLLSNVFIQSDPNLIYLNIFFWVATK